MEKNHLEESINDTRWEENIKGGEEQEDIEMQVTKRIIPSSFSSSSSSSSSTSTSSSSSSSSSSSTKSSIIEKKQEGFGDDTKENNNNVTSGAKGDIDDDRKENNDADFDNHPTFRTSHKLAIPLRERVYFSTSYEESVAYYFITKGQYLSLFFALRRPVTQILLGLIGLLSVPWAAVLQFEGANSYLQFALIPSFIVIFTQSLFANVRMMKMTLSTFEAVFYLLNGAIYSVAMIYLAPQRQIAPCLLLMTGGWYSLIIDGVPARSRKVWVFRILPFVSVWHFITLFGLYFNFGKEDPTSFSFGGVDISVRQVALSSFSNVVFVSLKFVMFAIVYPNNFFLVRSRMGVTKISEDEAIQYQQNDGNDKNDDDDDDDDDAKLVRPVVATGIATGIGVVAMAARNSVVGLVESL